MSARRFRLPADSTQSSRSLLITRKYKEMRTCDDVNQVRCDQDATSAVFELIAERYERRSRALTVNQLQTALAR